MFFQKLKSIMHHPTISYMLQIIQLYHNSLFYTILYIINIMIKEIGGKLCNLKRNTPCHSCSVFV